MTTDGPIPTAVYLVVYPVLEEVGAVLIDGEGNGMCEPIMGKRPDDVIDELCAGLVVGTQVTIVPGWAKAPEGLRDTYRAKQAAKRGRGVVWRREDDQ